MSIIFFGTFRHAVPALEALIKNGFEIAAVVTNPDSPQGRKKELAPNPVKFTAQKYGLNILHPLSLKDNKSAISPTLDPRLLARDGASNSFGTPASPGPPPRVGNSDKKSSSGYIADLLSDSDLAIVVGYSKILPKETIDLPKYGVLNIHPSLLPAYRGPSPVQSAILNGETETGVTIMQIDEEVDHGPILFQAKYQIPPDAYGPQITQELFRLGAELLIQIIPDWLNGKITSQPQNHAQATFTKKFTWPDGRIDWSQPAEKIYNQIRALNPEPGTWTTWKPGFQVKILKILKVYPPHQGSTLIQGRTLDLPVIPLEVRPEGKKTMSFEDFLRGTGQKEIRFE